MPPAYALRILYTSPYIRPEPVPEYGIHVPKATLCACATSGIWFAGHCASLRHSGTLRRSVSISILLPPEAQLSIMSCGNRSKSPSHSR